MNTDSPFLDYSNKEIPHGKILFNPHTAKHMQSIIHSADAKKKKNLKQLVTRYTSSHSIILFLHDKIPNRIASGKHMARHESKKTIFTPFFIKPTSY